MKVFVLLMVIFLVLPVTAMNADEIIAGSIKDNGQNVRTEQKHAKSLLALSKSKICRLLTTVDPKEMDDSIYLLKKIIEQDDQCRDRICLLLIEQYKYRLFEIYKCAVCEFPIKLLCECDNEYIMLKNELNNDNIMKLKLLVDPWGAFAFRQRTIKRKKWFVLMREIDKNIFQISKVGGDYLSIKGNNHEDYLLITCKKRKMLVKIGQMCQIAEFGCIVSTVRAPEELKVFSLDDKFVLTKTDAGNEIVWRFDLPKLSFEQLVLVLKLYNLKLAKKKFEGLFEYPIFKEIFANIFNKDRTSA